MAMPSQSKHPAKDRNWREALLWAAMIVGIATGASALINPLLDRTVHWNIVAVLMPTLFVLFSFLLKKRWV
jgi:hypothetical protein